MEMSTFSAKYGKSRKKISKTVEELNNTIYQLDLIDVYATLSLTRAE